MFTNPCFASSVCNVDKKKLRTVAENISKCTTAAISVVWTEALIG